MCIDYPCMYPCVHLFTGLIELYVKDHGRKLEGG